MKKNRKFKKSSNVLRCVRSGIRFSFIAITATIHSQPDPCVRPKIRQQPWTFARPSARPIRNCWAKPLGLTLHRPIRLRPFAPVPLPAPTQP